MPGIDAATMAAITRRATELANAAPLLSAEQEQLLASLISRYDDGGGEAP